MGPSEKTEGIQGYGMAFAFQPIFVFLGEASKENGENQGYYSDNTYVETSNSLRGKKDQSGFVDK